jgi:hypothetical protein
MAPDALCVFRRRLAAVVVMFHEVEIHENPMPAQRSFSRLTLPANQGTAVKVCVTPDAQAMADKIKMRIIDDFAWTRTSPNVVNQSLSAVAAAN